MFIKITFVYCEPFLMYFFKIILTLFSHVSPTEKKSEPEPSFEILTNPARVVPAQEKFIKFLQDIKYVPVMFHSNGRECYPLLKFKFYIRLKRILYI